MGMSANAELTFGIPVARYDSDDHETALFQALWNEEDEDFISLPEPLVLEWFGHYDDPDGPRAVLSISGVPTFRGDTWSPGVVDTSALHVTHAQTTAAEKAAYSIGLELDFLVDGRWLLVASYG